VAPGGRVTPHFDIGYAEHFRGRQGRLGLQIGEQTRTLGPGEEALAQPGQLHAWRNDASEPAVAVVELRPGHAGSEKALCVAYRLAADGMPRNPLHAALPLQ